MSTYERILALGEKHLEPRPSEGEILLFEQSIGDEESVVYGIVGALHHNGVLIPRDLLVRVREECSWSETLAELIDVIISPANSTGCHRTSPADAE